MIAFTYNNIYRSYNFFNENTLEEQLLNYLLVENPKIVFPQLTYLINLTKQIHLLSRKDIDYKIWCFSIDYGISMDKIKIFLAINFIFLLEI